MLVKSLSLQQQQIKKKIFKKVQKSYFKIEKQQFHALSIILLDCH